MSNPLYGSNKFDNNVGWLINPGEPSQAIGTGAQTITIEEVLNQIIEEDPEGAATWTLPTAALAVAGVKAKNGGSLNIGDCVDFYIINNATAGADEIVTMAVGTGGTAVGNLLVAAGNVTEDEENSGSAHFRIRFTNVTASSEAYDLFRLG